MEAPPPFDDLISRCEHSAVHMDRPWFDLVRAHVARGVEFRRARIVSEPVTDYIRFEHEGPRRTPFSKAEQPRPERGRGCGRLSSAPGGPQASSEGRGFTNYFLWLEIPNLRNVLRRKAERGCRVRFLVGDPDSGVTRRREKAEGVPLTVSTRIRITLAELGKLDGAPNLEARFGDDHIAMSVFKFDDQMLVTPHLARLVGHDSPMLHLRRCQDDGLFDRFAFHVAELWDTSRAINLEQCSGPPE